MLHYNHTAVRKRASPLNALVGGGGNTLSPLPNGRDTALAFISPSSPLAGAAGPSVTCYTTITLQSENGSLPLSGRRRDTRSPRLPLAGGRERLALFASRPRSPCSHLRSPLGPRVRLLSVTLQSHYNPKTRPLPFNGQEGGALAPLSLTGGARSPALCLSFVPSPPHPSLSPSSASAPCLGLVGRHWVPPQRLARSSPRTAHRTGVVCPPRGTPAHFRASPPARRPGSRLEAVSGTRPEVAWARARARRAAS